MLLRLSLKERKYYGLIFQSVITLVTVSVIGSTLAITINPIEFVRFQRDRQRVNDLNRLNEIIKFIEANIPQAIHTEKNVIYTSLPDEDPQCASWRERGLMPLGSIFSYHCASPESYRNTNGTGWVPVDFRVLDELKDFHDFAQAAFEQLPIDPSNGKQGIDPESGEETLFFYQYMGGSTLVHSNIAESIKIMEDISQQPLDEEIRALVEAVLAGQEIDYIQGSVGSGFWVGSASGDALNAKDRAREMLLIISNNVKANTLSLERQVSPEQLERLINSISDALSVLEEEVETSPSIILSPPSLTSPILATKECWDGS
ncbi:MAG: hypothetical protein ABH822_02385, partial [Patescibacteria group bacterium]